MYEVGVGGFEGGGAYFACDFEDWFGLFGWFFGGGGWLVGSGREEGVFMDDEDEVVVGGVEGPYPVGCAVGVFFEGCGSGGFAAPEGWVEDVEFCKRADLEDACVAGG
jgi:hypothetical protein